MKFSEVITELEKNPNKKFITNRGEYDIGISINNNGSYNFEYISANKTVYQNMWFLNGIFPNDEWEEVKSSIEVGDIEVGDKVIIANEGEIYPSYYSWFKENNVDIDIAARYQYHIVSLLNDEYEYVVVAKKGYIYAIQDKNDKVYLIGEDGIRKI